MERFFKSAYCPRADSNCHYELRRPVFYPLNYEDQNNFNILDFDQKIQGKREASPVFKSFKWGDNQEKHFVLYKKVSASSVQDCGGVIIC